MIQYTTGQRREIAAAETLREYTALRDLFTRPGFTWDLTRGVLTVQVEDDRRMSTGEYRLLMVLGSLMNRELVSLSDLAANLDEQSRAAIIAAVAILFDISPVAVPLPGEVTDWSGCDCTELCSMGPTCPGGGLAGLPGSGCWRTAEQPDCPECPEAEPGMGCAACGKPLPDEVTAS